MYSSEHKIPFYRTSQDKSKAGVEVPLLNRVNLKRPRNFINKALQQKYHNEALSPSKQFGCQQKSVANFIKLNLIVFKFSQIHIKKFHKFQGFQICAFFVQLQWLFTNQQFFDFSLNKSCQSYLGPMLPPGGRYWQLISPQVNEALSPTRWQYQSQV